MHIVYTGLALNAYTYILVYIGLTLDAYTYMNVAIVRRRACVSSSPPTLAAATLSLYKAV
jgi:hypothetical protein